MFKLKLSLKNRILLYMDLILVLAFVIDMEEHFTGLHIHELVGLGIGAILIVHIIFHWNWLVGITLKLFQRFFQQSRLSYLLSLLLFVDMVVVVVTGIVISRTIGLNFNVQQGPGSFPWESVHRVSSDLSLVIVGLHIAISWEWIVTNSKKYFFGFLNSAKRPTRAAGIVKEEQPANISTSTKEV